MKFNKRLNITVTKEDGQNCSEYISNFNCLLATALKRQFPDMFINVSPRGMRFNNAFYYRFSETTYNKIHAFYKLRREGKEADFEGFSFVAAREAY